MQGRGINEKIPRERGIFYSFSEDYFFFLAAFFLAAFFFGAAFLLAAFFLGAAFFLAAFFFVAIFFEFNVLVKWINDVKNRHNFLTSKFFSTKFWSCGTYAERLVRVN